MERPDAYWRNTIRGGLYRFQGDDKAFAHCTAEWYAKEKAEGPGIGLYMMAVAQLACGRLDVVEDILDNLPSGRRPARILARSIEDLLPVEKGTDVLYKTEAFREWFGENRPFLEWSQDQGRFALKRPQE